jgi:hypothetical protein
MVVGLFSLCLSPPRSSTKDTVGVDISDEAICEVMEGFKTQVDRLALQEELYLKLVKASEAAPAKLYSKVVFVVCL